MVVDPDIMSPSMAGGRIGDTITATHCLAAERGPAGSSISELYLCLVEVTESAVGLVIRATHLSELHLLTLLLGNYRRNTIIMLSLNSARQFPC